MGRILKREMMIKKKNYLNYELCKECGGACCKFMPGECFPEDFGEPLLENLIEAFESGNWAIDWWEGDPRKNEDKLDRAYYIRPRIKGINKLFDPSWGGECIFLNKKVCILPPEKRPMSCKMLEPKPKGEDCIHHNGTGKREAAIAWLPFTDVILKASRRIKE